MTPRIVRLSLVAFLFCASVRSEAQTPPTAGAPANPPAPSAAVARINDPIVPQLKLADAPIDSVLDLLTIYTGRGVLRPGAGLPTTLYSVDLKNIPRSEAIVAIETLLAINGVAVTPLNDHMMNVTALGFAKSQAPEMITGSTLGLPPSGRIAVKVFQLEFLRAQEFIGGIQGILNPQVQGGLAIFAGANAVMITDTLTTLQRVELLMKALDKPVITGMTPKFYTLTNGAKASDLVNKIRVAFGNTMQQQLGTSTTLSADDRTNQIIVMSDSRLYPVFDELIAKLDVKADPNTRNEVIYLKHAEAKTVQELLNRIVQGQTAALQRNAAQSVRPGQFNLPGQPNINLPTALPNQPGAPVLPGAPVAATPPTNVVSGIEGAPGSAEFSSIINVVNDDRSNSIIVSGTVDDIRLIKELVNKMDTILAQVRIEVIIAEVTLSDTDKSGISKLNLTFGTDTPAGPGGDNGRGTHITNFAASVAGWDVSSGIVNPLAFAAAFGDAGNRSNLKVLQAPTIVTTHAKKGQVIVGQEVPYISNATSSTATAGTSDVVNQSVAFKQINLDLQVTPLIGDDGSIQLNIDQLIQDQIGSITVNGSPTPSIGTRHAISFVNVFDGQMIVLGGLQRTSLTNSRDKLGFIREIPLLSHLLGNRTLKTERTELLLFIRPHVLKPEEGSADAAKTIETLSNKEQVKQYLQDPGKTAKEGFFEKLK